MSAVLLSHQACRHEFPTVGACSNSAFVKSALSQVLQYWALSCLAFIGDADRRKQKKKKKKAERALRCVILLLNRSSRQKRRNRWSSERSCFLSTGSAARLSGWEVWGSVSIPAGPASFWCFCAWKITHWVPLLYPPLLLLPLSVGDCSVADTYCIKRVTRGCTPAADARWISCALHLFRLSRRTLRWFQGTVF